MLTAKRDRNALDWLSLLVGGAIGYIAQNLPSPQRIWKTLKSVEPEAKSRAIFTTVPLAGLFGFWIVYLSLFRGIEINAWIPFGLSFIATYPFSVLTAWLLDKYNTRHGLPYDYPLNILGAPDPRRLYRHLRHQ